jgi:phosphoribosylformimino-5-aminoimidazole carboxamide ribotide isomerase
MDFHTIPAVDIKDGRCVRLFQGRYDQETVFSEDPAEVARKWEAEGARRVHVVDLDGALAGALQNLDVVRAIARALSIPITFGGGLRDLQSIRQLLEVGVDRVVLGTAAVEAPNLVEQAAQAYEDRVAVALDARDGVIVTRGWTEASGEPAMDVAARMVRLGVRRLIYTDVSRDGTLTEPNFESVSQLIAAIDVPVVASGGVSRVDHLVRLRDLGAEAAIVGRALYTGDIDMARLRQLGVL